MLEAKFRSSSVHQAGISDAVWIISEGVVSEDIAAGRLVALPVDTAETHGPVGLTTRTDTALSLPAEMLMQSIRDIAKGLR